jgi:branched-chain amino acid transport system substrate-binding protein
MRRALPWILLGVFAVLVPFLFGSFRVGQFTLVLAYAVTVLGLNVLVGYSGQISLGHGAFFAIGAYTAAILIGKHGWPHLATIPAAGALAGLAGFLVGLPALRVRGLYLALLTLGLAVATPPVIKRAEGLTGGSQGINIGGPKPPSFLDSLASDQFIYLLTLAVAVVLFVLVANLLRTRVGRALITIRDNEIVAKSMGVNIAAYKTGAFALSAAYAGIGGALYMFTVNFASPESFTLTQSISFLAAVVVGGLATVIGPLFGALFIVLVPEYAADVDDALAGVIYGAVLIVVMYVERGGIVGAGRRIMNWVASNKGGSMQRRSSMATVIALVIAAALIAAGCGRSDSGGGAKAPGVTDSSIKLGTTFPLSGPASAYATISRASTAYFKMINAKGGVNGRKISYIVRDDGYDPARAVSNARRLITQDKVFALFNPLGTPPNLAIWDYVNQQKVPQLFVATGASDFGKDVKKHPWTIGWQPDYVTEATAFGEYLKKVKPGAKVAVLYQNDGFGKDFLGGFQKEIEGSDIKIVAKQSYEVTDPTVSPQVVKLAKSGADTFLDIATPKPTAQAIGTVAKIGSWKPLHMISNVSASKNLVFKPVGLAAAKGIVSNTYVKDPESSQFATDAAMKSYKSQLKKYAPRLNPDEPFNVYGWAVAETMVKTLQQAGKDLTRDNVMKAARNLDTSVGLLLPQVKLKTSASDGYPLQSVQVQRFDGQNWKVLGGVFNSTEQ